MASPKHSVISPHCDPMVVIHLAQDQPFRVEPGAMVAMTPNVELSSTSPGGLAGLIDPNARQRARFQSIYTALGGEGRLTLAPAYSGDIFAMDLDHHTLLVQSLSFLGCDAELTVDEEVPGGPAFFGRDGQYLVSVSGVGKVLLAAYGGFHLVQLAEGERYVVDTGHVMAFQSHTRYEVYQAANQAWLRMVSAETLVCEFEGPGEVLIQTRNLADLAENLRPLARA